MMARIQTQPNAADPAVIKSSRLKVDELTFPILTACTCGSACSVSKLAAFHTLIGSHCCNDVSRFSPTRGVPTIGADGSSASHKDLYSLPQRSPPPPPLLQLQVVDDGVFLCRARELVSNEICSFNMMMTVALSILAILAHPSLGNTFQH